MVNFRNDNYVNQSHPVQASNFLYDGHLINICQDMLYSYRESTISNIMEYHDRSDASADFSDENSSYGHEQYLQPYSWSGNAYYNGQIGKLDIDLNVDFVTRKLVLSSIGRKLQCRTSL